MKTNEFERVEREVQIEDGQGQDWTNLTDVHRYFFYHNRTRRVVRTFKYNSNTEFVYSVQVSMPKAIGDNRKYWEQLQFTYLKVNGNSVTGDRALVYQVLPKLHLEWASEDESTARLCYKSSKVLLAVLKGRLTNPHQAYQYANRVLYKGSFTPNLLGRALVGRVNCSLWDLIWYTTNPNHALTILMGEDPRKTPEFQKAFIDSLYYARILGEKINPKWDLETLHRRHQIQIEEEIKLEGSTKDSSNVYKGVNIKLPKFREFSMTPLCTEFQCYLNARNMHNCTYSVYWSRIKEGLYIVLRGDNGSTPFNLGIKVIVIKKEDINCVVAVKYDQVSYSGNVGIPKDMADALSIYVRDNHELLEKMARSAIIKMWASKFKF